jgi:hypothetical protein
MVIIVDYGRGHGLFDDRPTILEYSWIVRLGYLSVLVFISITQDHFVSILQTDANSLFSSSDPLNISVFSSTVSVNRKDRTQHVTTI